MKIPCCSVCQTRYNEDERVPLLLQCGHGFCKECLSRMFSASTDTTLPCPRCRHVSVVGNSVQALRKNYTVLSLIHSALNTSGRNFDYDHTDDEKDGGEDEDGGYNDENLVMRRRWCNRGSQASSSGGCGPVIEVGVHHELKLVNKIGEGRRAGIEMWTAVIGGGEGGRCRHHVAVKKLAVMDDMDLDWVQGKLENLRRASMWCRNVCTFHGAVRMEGSICIVIDRCYGSIQSEMQKNKGRLTLEQILRFGLVYF